VLTDSVCVGGLAAGVRREFFGDWIALHSSLGERYADDVVAQRLDRIQDCLVILRVQPMGQVIRALESMPVDSGNVYGCPVGVENVRCRWYAVTGGRLAAVLGALGLALTGSESALVPAAPIAATT